MGEALVRGLIIVVAALGQAENSETQPNHKTEGSTLAREYRADVERIVAAALEENDAYDKLEELCVTIGHRLSGSRGLEKAIDWAIAKLKKDGAVNVHREKVLVPHWVRGAESAVMVKPRVQPLHMLGLGGSIATPPGGITAPVMVVADADELEAAGEKARGKIVLFNKVMPPYDPQRGASYGPTVRYRSNGARLAAQKGAVAALVRSVTATSLSTPHTGAMRYGDAAVRIPTAAVSVEDAEMIRRLTARGLEVVVNLKMEAQTLPDAVSANVIGELPGRTNPEEVVVISGHFDSWDVGQGAHDDGGGCVIAMEAINVLRRLDMFPRRTIRVVLWTNEENGLRGGRTYAKEHAEELERHVAAIESDSGVFLPVGYSVQCVDKQRESIAAERLGDLMSLFTSTIGPMNVKTGFSGADVSPMKDSGTMLLGHRVEGSKYFDYHHTHADTIDKVDRDDLSRNVAVLAAVAYVLADMPGRIGERPSN